VTVSVDLAPTPIATNTLNEIAAGRTAYLHIDEGLDLEDAKAAAMREREVWKAHMLSGFFATIDERPCVFDRRDTAKAERPAAARQERLI